MTDDQHPDEHERVTKAERVAISAYLDVVRTPKTRGRQRTLASAERDLANVITDLDGGELTPLEELQLTQRRIDLEREVEERSSRANVEELEAQFVGSAAKYGRLKGITYTAWRTVGVEAAVLKKAGIGRAADA